MNTVKRLVIHGLVQGVFFRDSMRREANRLNVSGWVRNCADGSVEAVVQGDAVSIDAIVVWAHHGPAHARVTHVDVAAGSGSYDGFVVTG